MEEFGFKDILHKGTVRVNFERMNNISESCISFIYMCKIVFKTRKERWKFEHEYPTKKVSAPFKNLWKVRNEGQLDPNTNMVNIKISMNNAILNMNTELKFCDRKLGARKFRGQKFEYKVKKLEAKAWYDYDSAFLLRQNDVINYVTISHNTSHVTR